MHLQFDLNLEETTRMLRCLEIEPQLYETPEGITLMSSLYIDEAFAISQEISMIRHARVP